MLFTHCIYYLLLTSFFQSISISHNLFRIRKPRCNRSILKSGLQKCNENHDIIQCVTRISKLFNVYISFINNSENLY